VAITIGNRLEVAQQLFEIYQRAEVRMLGIIKSRLAKGMAVSGWANAKYAEVWQVRESLQNALTALQEAREPFIADSIAQAYTEASEQGMTDARKLLGTLNADHIAGNAEKVINILSDLTNTLRAEDRQILRQANDKYADIIGRVSASVATGTITVKQALQDALDDFADEGIRGFEDRAGRHWEMTTYAEMAILTAIERATREGYVDTMQSYGFDLAIISSHSGACPLCEAWQGVIVSVSGSTRGYPSLADAESSGLFHPRCLHTLDTYFAGVTPGGRNAPRAVQAPNAEYTLRQQQRAAERQTRRWKRRMATAIDPQAERYAYAKVREWQQRIRSIIQQADKDLNTWLPRKYDREGGRVTLSEAARKLPPVKLGGRSVGS